MLIEHALEFDYIVQYLYSCLVVVHRLCVVR